MFTGRECALTYSEVFLIAIGLSMDAFAAALCKGLCLRKVYFKQATLVGLFFGGFQALMPVIGWFLGKQFSKYIETFDHWIALALLGILGGKMIYEAFKEEEVSCNLALDLKELTVMGVATSIDALVVGITLASLKANIFSAATLIGVVTFVIATIGVYIGKGFGTKYKKRAELIGGFILIAMGIKIFIEHMFM